MSDSLGRLCIVLHAHLPYVLHHGQSPHGEAWLYEAAAETYLPLLDLIGEVALHRCRPALTIGLTPILLEQLSHKRFKEGFVEYLAERTAVAERDCAEFESRGEAQLALLARRWVDWYQRQATHFERIGHDIPGDFAARSREGHIQILSGPATHPYLPLLLEDDMIAAQLRIGLASSRRILGDAVSSGIWLPECAYRPANPHWTPPVLDRRARSRQGLEKLISDSGVDHFVVDSQLISDAQPLGTMRDGQFVEISEAQLHWDRRKWQDPQQPAGIASAPHTPDCSVLARHPCISEQVWSRTIGYPGDGQYLDFHRRQNAGGLRYHRVTDLSTPMGEKQQYVPEDVYSKQYEHVQHFCGLVIEALKSHLAETGKPGVCVAAFDAELFGHWWFEGPAFLRDVIFTITHRKKVGLATMEETLRDSPPERVVRLPEGSWGEGGHHAVWLNDQTRWMWEIEHRAENRLKALLPTLPWRTDPAVRQMLVRAARELLLLQASDWPFVVHSKGAVDYGIQRFSGHATRFDRATHIAERIAAGGELTEVEKIQIAEMDAHDLVFADLDLGAFVPTSNAQPD
jgi:1,4-alpha-glucan branching enzyme